MKLLIPTMLLVCGVNITGKALACDKDLPTTSVSVIKKSIIEKHKSYSLKAIDAKSLDGPALERANWCELDVSECTQQFELGVERYLSANPESALIVYAGFDTKICSLLFLAGREPILNIQSLQPAILEQWIIEYTHQISGWSTSNAPRTARLAKTNALRDGRCNVDELENPAIHQRGHQRGATLTPNSANPNPSVTDKLDKALSNSLFPETFKNALLQVKHVTIVPFGSISTLPVSTLYPFGDNRRAVDSFSINYLLFAGDVIDSTFIDASNDKPAYWTGQFNKPLILGNPIPTDIDRKACFSELEYAELEAKAVADIWDASPYLQHSATKATYTKNSKDADLIYFAAHGIAGRNSGLTDSFIALADTNLNAEEVQELSQFKLSAELVVMSACETGLGVIKDFGVVGLARTFLDAGARNVVMSLWLVNDEATYYLMSEFNRKLANEPPSVALQHAQLYLQNEFPQFKKPEYWAGFAVYGKQISMSSSSAH